MLWPLWGAPSQDTWQRQPRYYRWYYRWLTRCLFSVKIFFLLNETQMQKAKHWQVYCQYLLQSILLRDAKMNINTDLQQGPLTVTFQHILFIHEEPCATVPSQAGRVLCKHVWWNTVISRTRPTISQKSKYNVRYFGGKAHRWTGWDREKAALGDLSCHSPTLKYKLFVIFLKHLCTYLKGLQEGETGIFHPLTQSPKPPPPGRKSTPAIQASTGAGSPCFPKHFSRELGWRCGSQTRPRSPMGTRCHNASPSTQLLH